MTNENEIDFQKAIKCHICDKQYKDLIFKNQLPNAQNELSKRDKDVRVRDHCHITGKFRGSAHQDCNLKLRINPYTIKIPVIFHNLRGYDSHFIMQQIGQIAKEHIYTNKKGQKVEMNINAIPNNMENIWLSCLVIILYSLIVFNS